LEFSDRTALPNEIARLKQRVGPIRFGQGPVIDAIARQLDTYFSGRSAVFDIPVVQEGTPFETSVWTELRWVPPGETRSYGQIARAIGRPDAPRAVARANGANQVAIVVPCHRIIGQDGSLAGYGGKIWRKKWLLEHERRMAANTSDQ
jgi:AraC family transcriptional regulator of adaptative response/methylated-DNA-[protein]-cysteine methyltransferase